VITVTREYGAGGGELAGRLAASLGWELLDRELLHQAAEIEHVPDAEIDKIDERAAGMFQRFRPGSVQHRYFGAIGQRMHELALQGEAVLVGRGGSRILRNDPRALHVQLVAPMGVRVRRVMEYRWVSEAVANRLIAQSDTRRRSFYQGCFQADWCSPLEYHITVNSGRLGPAAVDLVATAAIRHWSHREQVN